MNHRSAIASGLIFIRHIKQKCQIRAACLLLVALIFISMKGSPIDAQVTDHSHFDTWSVDQGLPQNSVNSLLQTRDGYLWCATPNGLARFDGVRFTVFDKANSPGITSNRFLTLAEDEQGSLWAGTEGSGLTRYKDGVFTTYTAHTNSLYNRVRALQPEKDGSLWLLTDGGLARWQNETLTPYTRRGRLAPGLEPNWRQLINDSKYNSALAFVDEAGLNIIRGEQLQTLTARDGLSSLKIDTLTRDQGGALWVGTLDAGLNRIRDGKITVLTKRDGLPSDRVQIRAVCEDRRGYLWFALLNAPGLYRLKNGVLAHYDSAAGLSGDQVLNIYEDREGSIWIGTGDGGISRWREATISVYSRRDGLGANNVYPVLEDRAGRLWIGTWPGLNKYQSGKFTPYSKTDGPGAQLITSLYEDEEGSLWVGTHGSGVYRFKHDRFTAMSFPVSTKNDSVTAIYRDTTGMLWFGTTMGLFKYERGTFTQFTTDNGLPHLHITSIHEDRAGNLWLGTQGGLARLKKGAFTSYSESDGLSSRHIRSFYEDEGGALWIGTYDGGLNRLKDGRFTRYTRRDGLFDNGVFRILDDARGNFWMSSNRGICRVSRRELEDFAAGKLRSFNSIGYGRRDGMLNQECNGGVQPAGVKTRDGRLWFPTQDGLAVVDPETIRSNPLPPPVLIEEITLDDRRVAFGQSGVRVLPGQTRVEIHYTGLSYLNSDQVRFKYRLEGLEAEWVDAGARRSANYSYVPPGDYTFRVIAANSDGVWNEVGAAVRLIVEPPFWRTWWFFGLMAGGIGGLLLLGYQTRVAQLKRAQAEQEDFARRLLDSQEQERQRIAAELHDGLGQSLLIIKNRARLALRSANDQDSTEEQLNEIAASATHAIEEVRGIAHNLRPYQLERFGLSKTLQAIVTQAARVCAIRFTSEIEPLDNLLSPQAETSIYRIVQEAINNIIKHSQATDAKLIARDEGQAVIISIEDNGRGFLPVKETPGRPRRGGFGLIGMSERVHLLGGTITIDGIPGWGTAISIRIPKTGNEHES